MTTWTKPAACAALLLATASFAGAQPLAEDRLDRRGGFRNLFADCLTITGLTADQKLIRMNSCEPTYPRSVRGIAGLTGTDTRLVAIDYRVQDGKLYGLGIGGGIYVIDPSTGMAVKSRQLSIALSGDSFGMDFNPAADALRIVSNTGQNLRHPFADPLAATVADGALNYTAGTTATGITAGAYINNDLSPDTGTFLFDIDSLQNQLALQVPPNAGSLVRIGALGLDPGSEIGFDIYTKVKDEVAAENTGYAAMTTDGVTRLYEINLLTGKATRIDMIREAVIDIALPLEQWR